MSKFQFQEIQKDATVNEVAGQDIAIVNPMVVSLLFIVIA